MRSNARDSHPVLTLRPAYQLYKLAAVQPGGPMTILLDVSIGMSESGAEEIVASGIQSDTGRDIVVRTIPRPDSGRHASANLLPLPSATAPQD
jgi:hypothetical protein